MSVEMFPPILMALRFFFHLLYYINCFQYLFPLYFSSGLQKKRSFDRAAYVFVYIEAFSSAFMQ